MTPIKKYFDELCVQYNIQGTFSLERSDKAEFISGLDKKYKIGYISSSIDIWDYDKFQYFKTIIEKTPNKHLKIYDQIKTGSHTVDNGLMRCMKPIYEHINKYSDFIQMINKLELFISQMTKKYEIGKYYYFKTTHTSSFEFLGYHTVSTPTTIFVKIENKKNCFIMATDKFGAKIKIDINTNINNSDILIKRGVDGYED